MKIGKIKNLITLSVLSCMTFFSLGNLTAGITKDAKRTFNEYMHDFPYIGLVSDKISYGPIKLSKVKIDGRDKLVVAASGEELHGTLKYKVESKDLNSLHLYHLVIGIKDEGAQDCITHSLGFWNAEGKGSFTIVAPQERGVYEVRFLFTDALTCESARDIWNSGDKTPSSSATVGIIIVE